MILFLTLLPRRCLNKSKNSSEIDCCHLPLSNPSSLITVIWKCGSYPGLSVLSSDWCLWLIHKRAQQEVRAGSESLLPLNSKVNSFYKRRTRSWTFRSKDVSQVWRRSRWNTLKYSPHPDIEDEWSLGNVYKQRGKGLGATSGMKAGFPLGWQDRSDPPASWSYC